MSASKSATPEQNSFARAKIRRLIKDRWGDDFSAAAKALGVSQPTVSEFLSGKKGIGTKLLTGVARHDPRLAGMILAGREVIDTEGSEVLDASQAIERIRTIVSSTVGPSPANKQSAATLLPGPPDVRASTRKNSQFPQHTRYVSRKRDIE